MSKNPYERPEWLLGSADDIQHSWVTSTLCQLQQLTEAIRLAETDVEIPKAINGKPEFLRARLASCWANLQRIAPHLLNPAEVATARAMVLPEVLRAAAEATEQPYGVHRHLADWQSRLDRLRRKTGASDDDQQTWLLLSQLDEAELYHWFLQQYYDQPWSGKDKLLSCRDRIYDQRAFFAHNCPCTVARHACLWSPPNETDPGLEYTKEKFRWILEEMKQ